MITFENESPDYYVYCDERYNCCYALHYIFYFFGIVVIIISDYLKIYQKHFVIITMLILNIFTGGFGTILFIDVFNEPDEYGFRNQTSSRFWVLLGISILSVPVFYNAVFFCFFSSQLEDNGIMILFLLLYLFTYIYMAYNFFKYGYYDKLN